MNDASTEQGIKVFQVSDYEWIAAYTEDEAVAFSLKAWGYDDAKEAEEDGCFVRADVAACDLDGNKVNVSERAEEGDMELVTYRESLKRHIANGDTFPRFFAGIDG